MASVVDLTRGQEEDPRLSCFPEEVGLLPQDGLVFADDILRIAPKVAPGANLSISALAALDDVLHHVLSRILEAAAAVGASHRAYALAKWARGYHALPAGARICGERLHAGSAQYLVVMPVPTAPPGAEAEEVAEGDGATATTSCWIATTDVPATCKAVTAWQRCSREEKLRCLTSHLATLAWPTASNATGDITAATATVGLSPPDLGPRGRPNELSQRELEVATMRVLPGLLGKWGVMEGRKAVEKMRAQHSNATEPDKAKGDCDASDASSRGTPVTVKAGLEVSVATVGALASLHGDLDVSVDCACYLAAAIEYMAAEILEISGNRCKDARRNFIHARDITLALEGDHELCKALAPCAVLFGGRTPCIDPLLVYAGEQGDGWPGGPGGWRDVILTTSRYLGDHDEGFPAHQPLSDRCIDALMARAGIMAIDFHGRDEARRVMEDILAQLISGVAARMHLLAAGLSESGQDLEAVAQKVLLVQVHDVATSLQGANLSLFGLGHQGRLFRDVRRGGLRTATGCWEGMAHAERWLPTLSLAEPMDIVNEPSEAGKAPPRNAPFCDEYEQACFLPQERGNGKGDAMGFDTCKMAALGFIHHMQQLDHSIVLKDANWEAITAHYEMQFLETESGQALIDPSLRGVVWAWTPMAHLALAGAAEAQLLCSLRRAQELAIRKGCYVVSSSEFTDSVFQPRLPGYRF